MNARIDHLERELRMLKLYALALTGFILVLLLSGFRSHGTDDQILRARALVIVDEQGRDRIIMGAPMPDPSEGERISPTIGMMINDTDGFERFGLGLQENGRVVMGFDAPPGTGDDRNRERITIVADQEGGAQIRFLDRETRVPARIYLDEENLVWVEFLEFPEGEVVRRRIGFSGEETIRQPR